MNVLRRRKAYIFALCAAAFALLLASCSKAEQKTGVKYSIGFPANDV